MSEMVSRWPVVVALPVASSDLDDNHYLTAAAAERFFAAARTVYFDQCTTVDESTLEILSQSVRLGAPIQGRDGVTVSVNVTEIYPDSFTMTARLRPRTNDGIAATASCTLSPGAEVPIAMRDEFIAHAHNARHFH